MDERNPGCSGRGKTERAVEGYRMPTGNRKTSVKSGNQPYEYTIQKYTESISGGC
jgi:hypothetical protein